MQKTMSCSQIGVFGARGYSGVELCRLLADHPNAQLQWLVSSHSNWSITDELDWSCAPVPPVISRDEALNRLDEIDLAFLATPADVSLELSRILFDAGKKVIDLSGALRLSPEECLKAYGLQVESSFLEQVVYGLSPFSNEKILAKAPRVISNPGCFPTSVLLALIPLLREKLIDPDSIVIDSKSGTTGAGRNAKERLLFSEVDGNILPYRIGKHQHFPEIKKYLNDFGSTVSDFHFVTHLLPVPRGILSSIYCNLTESGQSPQSIRDSYERAYQGYKLVDFQEIGESTEAKGNRFLSFSKTVKTPMTRIGYRVDSSKLNVFSSIDNLMKGAASQAVENLNLLNGDPPDLGLIPVQLEDKR